MSREFLCEGLAVRAVGSKCSAVFAENSLTIAPCPGAQPYWKSYILGIFGKTFFSGRLEKGSSRKFGKIADFRRLPAPPYTKPRGPTLLEI